MRKTGAVTVRVLLLGGTTEARHLAAALVGDPRVHVVSSLAGRIRVPQLPEGEVRVGGFGGVAGLAGWVRAERIDAVVDATHAFAQQITSVAVQACSQVGVPLLVLRRPEWLAGPGDDWRPVRSLSAAAALLPELGERVFLTSGRQEVAAFAALDRLWFLVRSVDPPAPPVPARTQVLLARGPFTVPGELALLREHRIDVLVTKNSGGAMTAAKLDAARRLGLPVVMVHRPPEPDVPSVTTVAEAQRWVQALVRQRD